MRLVRQEITRNKHNRIERIVFTFDGGQTLTAEPCYESWLQWGDGDPKLTCALLDKYNEQFDRGETEPLDTVPHYPLAELDERS